MDSRPPERARSLRQLRRPKTAAVIAVFGVYAWFASGVRTFTLPADVVIFTPALAVLTLTLRPSARRQQMGPGDRITRVGALLWVIAAVAVTGWELTQLFAKPRRAHPTLSSLNDSLLSTHPTRFLGLALWLFLGWLMVREWLVSRPGDRS